MARFYGEIGYGETVEATPGSGNWEDKITEFPYQGDVLRNTRQLQNAEKVNDDISVNNSISIVADQYAIDHFFNIRYVRWEGVCWTVSSVEVQRPRLILQLGSVYNGPTSNVVGTASLAISTKGELSNAVGTASLAESGKGDLE